MKRLKVNEIELAVEDRGAGLPVVLTHGFPLDHTMWAPQIERLSQSYRVIACDLRGFGQSEVTEGTVAMEQFADDSVAMLEALKIDDSVIFCGLSMGGYIATEFWRKYPDRLKGLILCGTRSSNDSPEIARARMEMADRVTREGTEVIVDGMIPKLFSKASEEEQPKIVQSLRNVMLSTDRRGVAAAARGMAQRADATPHLGDINCKSLVVVGQHDVISPPAEMKEIADAIPDSMFVEISGAGHMSPIEKPAQVNAAIERFLVSLS